MIKISDFQLKTIIGETIKEELGSFENQNQIAKYLATEAELAYKNGDYDIISTIPYSGPIKYAEIHITDDYVICNLSGINPRQKKAIINIPESVFSSKEKIQNLMNSVAHELMHGNVYLQQINHGYMPEMSLPDEYRKFCEVKTKEYNNGSDLYYFAYGVYSTYYNEVNAFVSQVSAEILDKAKNKPGILYMKDFQYLYAQTNSVLSFKANIMETNKIIRMTCNEINGTIVQPLKQYGITMGVDEVLSKCKEIRDISRRALKDCRRNAMLAYKELTKAGKLLSYNKLEPKKIKSI
jgi:hypothetical protein